MATWPPTTRTALAGRALGTSPQESVGVQPSGSIGILIITILRTNPASFVDDHGKRKSEIVPQFHETGEEELNAVTLLCQRTVVHGRIVSPPRLAPEHWFPSQDRVAKGVRCHNLTPEITCSQAEAPFSVSFALIPDAPRPIEQRPQLKLTRSM